MAEAVHPFTSSVALPRWVEDVLREHPALVLDSRGRLVAFSAAIEALLQRDLAPALGRLDYSGVAAPDREKAQRLLGAVLSGQAASLGVRAVTIAHRLPTGQVLPLLAEYHPVFDGDGSLALHLMIHHPVRLEIRPEAKLLTIRLDESPCRERWPALVEAALPELRRGANVLLDVRDAGSLRRHADVAAVAELLGRLADPLRPSRCAIVISPKRAGHRGLGPLVQARLDEQWLPVEVETFDDSAAAERWLLWWHGMSAPPGPARQAE